MIGPIARAAACVGLCFGIIAPAGAAGPEQSPPPAPPVPSPPVSAPLAPRTVRVAVFAEAPFAMQESSGRWSGYAVTFLDAAAADAQLVLEMQPCATMHELFQRVESGAADVAAGNTLVTSERLKSVDFSQPILDGGLRVMVPSDRSHSLSRILSGLWDNGHVHVVLWGALITIVAAAVLPAVLRRVDKEFTRHWHEGFAESLYHVVSVVMTGKTSYKGSIAPGWVGRIVAALWLVFGVASVAYLTSSLTSVMTSDAMASRISGPRDLHGKTVGTLQGSVGDRYCAEHSLEVVRFATVELAASALVSKQVDAVVADAQTLEYFDTSHPDVPVAVVGELFERRHYAFPMHRGDDDLRQRMDRSIVSLRESGAMDRMRARWFGK
jgi:ABC-type amino acid transport substrate-binding protein